MKEFAQHMKKKKSSLSGSSRFDFSARNKLWDLSNLSVSYTGLFFFYHLPVPEYIIKPSEPLE